MTIGQRIKTLRLEQRISQEELSRRLAENGVVLSQVAISQLEADRSSGTSCVASIAHVFGVNALWLETERGKRELDYVQPQRKEYYQEIKKVIGLMESTDERGREKVLIAAKDAVDGHNAWKNSLPRTSSEDDLAELSSRLTSDLLPESVQNESTSNDVYSPGSVEARKDKRH